MKEYNINKTNFLVVAKLGKTIGLDGKFLIHSFFSVPHEITNFKNFLLNDEKEISIVFDKNKKKIVGKIIGINSTEDVHKYIGKLLYLKKEFLPKLKKNQFYFEDLVNMEVLIQKKVIGSVKNVCCHGAGEYLEIKCKEKELLVPFNFDHIHKISLEKKQIFLSIDYYEI